MIAHKTPWNTYVLLSDVRKEHMVSCLFEHSIVRGENKVGEGRIDPFGQRLDGRSSLRGYIARGCASAHPGEDDSG